MPTACGVQTVEHAADDGDLLLGVEDGKDTLVHGALTAARFATRTMALSDAQGHATVRVPHIR